MQSLTTLKPTSPTSTLRSAATRSSVVGGPLRPVLKWAGGKRWQLPYLQILWKAYSNRRLVEPFAGGLAIALGLRPQSALLNDINPHVINFYRWLKSGFAISVRMANSRGAYTRSRNRFNYLIRQELHRTSEAAQLFYYLNRTGYNGLCRFNRSGEYNVPFGRHKSVEYGKDFSAYKDALKDWSFSSTDFENLRVAANDFIYADPPYDVDFTSYSKDGFTWDDQVRLANWLAEHAGPVVLSNQATARVVRLYRKLGFKLTFLQAPRMISCNGDRTPAEEVLAIKNF